MTESSVQPAAGNPPMEDPNRLARRLMQRAHNRDGLPEIVAGAFFLLVSAIMTGLLYSQEGSLPRKALALSMALLIPAMGLGTYPFIKWLRHRYLMAREGYFEYRPSRSSRISIVLLIASSVALAFWAANTARRGMVLPDRWLLAGTGVFGGLLAVLSGRSTRFKVEGLLLALAGVSIGLSGVSLTAGFALFFGFTGAMMAVLGVIALLRFMQQTAESGQ